jgi:hypothetical protein
MPHFDAKGGDQWMCQGPNHKGNRIQDSDVESQWRPDITGHESAGNCCPTCVTEHDSKQVLPLNCEHGVDVSKDNNGCLRCWLVQEAAREDLINPLDYADDKGELEVQQELRRTGVKNTPQPTVCPECKGALEQHSGMVGETVLSCPYHGIVWEDAEDAVRRVL